MLLCRLLGGAPTNTSKALKATFTFKVVQGEQFTWEIEVFFFNFKTKQLEPLSSSSQSTPRHLKIPFGFLKTVECVDTNLLSVINSHGDTALLCFDRLSPLLDDTDNRMKSTLIHLKEKGCEKIVNTLNSLLEQFHKEENSSEIGKDNDEDENSKNTESCVSSSLAKCATVSSSLSGLVCSETHSLRRNNSRMSRENSVSLLNKDFEASTSVSKSKKMIPAEEDFDEKGSNTGDDDYDDVVDRENVDISKSIEEIIRDAKFLAVKCEEIEIPKCISIDKVKVNQLKESLVKSPDKTQTFVGLVLSVNSEGNRVGNYECWVNCELLLAQMEIQLECEGAHGRVLSVLHTVYEENMAIDTKTVGCFLLANSKDFSAKFHDKVTYQDLLRFACRVLLEENSDRTKKFVRNSLRGFSKGNKYTGFFIQFASLPPQFLTEFEKFCRLYEEGSLHGMKLSTRVRCGIDQSFKRKDQAKLEVPIQLLKIHLRTPHAYRVKLLQKLLNQEITLSEYKEKLGKSADLFDVKSNVEKVSGESLSDLKSRYPNQFDDLSLIEFLGAKSLPSGPNMQFTKLAKHVKHVLEVQLTEEMDDSLEGRVTIVKAENLNTVTISKKVKEFGIVTIQGGIDTEFYNRFEYAIKEHVLGNKCVGIFVVSDSMKRDIEYNFVENVNVIVEQIYVKSDDPKTENGIVKEIVPIFLVAHKDLVKDRKIPNFYPCKLQEALPTILSSFVEVKESLLSIFSEQPIDLDPNGILIRKGVNICEET